MAKDDYIRRKTSNIRRKPPVSRKRRRRSGRPLLIVVFLIITIVSVVLILNNTGVLGSLKKTSEPAGSNSSSSVSADPSASENPQSTPIPESADDDLTPAQERDISNLDVETLNTMMIVGDRGYRYYKFSEENSINYIKTISAAGKLFSGSAAIYQITVPTAADIMLPQSFLADKNTSDQQKAMDYIAASINQLESSVKTVKLFDILKAHCDEEIYFRADRNWTSLGAYYAYRQFAKDKGIKPLALDAYTKQEYPDFWGSLYAQSDYRSAMEGGETLAAYVPPCSTTVSVTKTDGETFSSSLICDVTDYEASMKYCAFLGGDYPYTSIHNDDLSDGSACLVVKESMGNAFVPYLAPHYEYVFVVDYRYWSGNLKALTDEKGVADVIFINQIEATSDYDAIASLQSILPGGNE